MKEFLLTFSAVMTSLGISKLIKAVVLKAYYSLKTDKETNNDEY